MHLIKFPLLPSKIGCIFNSQLFHHMPSEISEIGNSVCHICSPKVVKIGWFRKEIFSDKCQIKGGRFIGTQCTTATHFIWVLTTAAQNNSIQCFLRYLVTSEWSVRLTVALLPKQWDFGLHSTIIIVYPVCGLCIHYRLAWCKARWLLQTGTRQQSMLNVSKKLTYITAVISVACILLSNKIFKTAG